MSTFWHAILLILRKASKTVMLLTIITIILTFCFASIIVLSVTKRNQQEATNYIGAKILVKVKQDANMNYPIPIFLQEGQIKQLEQIKHVTGASTKIETFALPINFTNVKTFTGSNPAEQAKNNMFDEEDLSNNIALIGAIDVSMVETFRNGKNVIIKGDYPLEYSKGVVISEELADLNSLTIGDKLYIETYTNNHDEITALTVSGVYRTKLFFHVLETNFWGLDAFAFSPYNQVYASYNVVSELSSQIKGLETITLYLDSASNLEKVKESILDLPWDWSRYNIYNLTSLEFKEFAGNLTVISKYCSILIAFSLIFGSICIFFILSLWSDETKYEFGIFLMLGKTKKEILQLKTFENMIILILSTLTSLFLALQLSKTFVNFLDFSYTSYAGEDMIIPFETGELIFSLSSTIIIDYKYILLLMLAVFGIGFCTVAMPCRWLYKYSPSDIIKKSNK